MVYYIIVHILEEQMERIKEKFQGIYIYLIIFRNLANKCAIASRLDHFLI